MSRKRFLKVAAPVLLAASLSAPPAQGALVLDNWLIDLNLVPETAGFGVIGASPPAGAPGIDSVTFNAISHAIGGAGFPLPGSQFTTSILGVATSFIGDAGIIPATGGPGTPPIRVPNLDFELTLAATTTQQVTGLVPQGIGFTHLDGTTPAVAGSVQVSTPQIVNGVLNVGILDIFIDNLTDAVGLKANTNPGTGGEGMTDGTLIASFVVLPGEGGFFNQQTLDGSDDAMFELISNPFGAVQDQFGVALAAGAIVAMTDANTDNDPDDNGLRDTTFPNGPLSGVCGGGQTAGNSCGLEDGSFSLAEVPEPSSLALLGLTLAGLGGCAAARRRRRG